MTGGGPWVLAGALLLTACQPDAPAANAAAATGAVVAAATTTGAPDTAPINGGKTGVVPAHKPASAAPASAAPVAAAGGGAGQMLTCPRDYDVETPNPAGPARIVDQRDGTQNGGMCQFGVAYPGGGTAYVTSSLGRCRAAAPRIYSVAQLRNAGQLDDLSPTDRADIERLDDIGVVGVTGETSWVVYVPDSDCVVREIWLAD